GAGEFTVEEAEKDGRGSTITLHMREDEGEFLEAQRLRHIVRTYSDHVALPIVLTVADGDDETLNQASALWTRPTKDITPEQYTEFYHHVGHAYDEPWLTLHWRAEGMLEYTNLIFVPSAKPFDLFHPDRKHHLKLYVKRVFITDNCEGLVPSWLRFLNGLVDSEDLKLNVSREMLQNNPMVTRMRGAIVKRVLGELAKKAEDAPDEYATFWDNFGAVLKEGMYEDAEHRDELIRLARFKSTASGDGLTSLADYVGRMKDGQQAIYYITGEELDPLRRSPQLEGFAARGIEVLLLTDPVDEFWIPAIGEFEEKTLKSATRAGADLSEIPLTDDADGEKKDDDADEKDAGQLDSLVAMFKLALADEVKDVRLSDRLTDSAACLVSDDGDMDINLERLLKQHNQLNDSFKRILEINPKHKLMRALAAQIAEDGAAPHLNDTAWLVLDQARILEGEKLSDPAAFSRRLTDALTRGLSVG
ncbi:MAG: molecular chaperone HtpG, partial [Rhodospirillales bacterium]|nr:molecular chaperone HtpG [Rhodospirillales bacterium]